MVSGLAGAALITIIALVWMVIGNQISTQTLRNDQLRNTLAQIKIHKEGFLEAKARMDADQQRLDRNQLKLVRLMESEATKLGITIEDFKETKRWLTDKHRRIKKRSEGAKKRKVVDLLEESQTVTIRRIGLKQLAEFLEVLESQREPVAVTRLSIQTLASDRQVLREVRMTVSTYRNEEVEL
ncbi:hypothetical protein KKF91_02775 [Myxococcota bacterium]|nr:hypothetical protein [Myxococcota bacterium]MBU1429464.1 hypothetical protein [Myxococcota bacterium]MBU1897483.1 hypothetical protein [Myxococcota bacterium]